MSRTKSEESKMTTCAACVLNDSDYSLKECNYCGFCGKWLCNRCQSSPRSRLKAVAKEKGMTIDNYLAKLSEWLKSHG